MAIYRGPGGAGDATNDATSQAILAAQSAVAAASSEAAAAASAVSASNSASSASTSATNAATSATNAAASATNAANSATSAASSATTATNSKNDAVTAQTAAELAETNAETAATNAASSASSALSSKNAAALSATAAATSATNASNSATAAATSASNAATSESNAASSATAAASSASAASTSATNAASSASTASTAATTATTQASNAATSATAAATSATNAASSATAAASSATSASTSASTATTQATNAASSATSASSSASSAAASAAAAAASYDNFDDRYLGTKSTAPTLDNDGNALVTGALYYNDGTSVLDDKGMWVYDGAQWLPASAAAQAILVTYDYTATSSQTTFTGADNNAVTLSYTPGSIIVTINGVVLDQSDYTATNGTSVVLASGATTGDEVNILAFSTFDVANTYTQAQADARFFNVTGDSISGNLTFTGTGNRITGDFSNATLANRVAFQTSTANGNTFLQAFPNGTGNTGALTIYNTNDGAVSSWVQSAIIGSTEARFSSSQSGGGTYLPMTFYTGGSERLRLDTSGNLGLGVTPSAWYSASKAIQVGNYADFYCDGASGATGIGSNFYQSAASQWRYLATAGASRYEANFGAHYWFTAPSGTAGNAISFTQAMTLDASGNLGIGTSSPAASLDIYKASDATQYVRTTAGVQLFSQANDSTASGTFGTVSNHPLRFITSSVERMRIDSSGNLLVGTTSGTSRLNVAGVSCARLASTGSANALIIDKDNTSGSLALFTYNSGAVGSITTNGTTTSYGTSSDYRLKENIQPMQNALEFCRKQRPVTYDWKSDGSKGSGYIAHWLQEDGAGNCVTGEKDAVDKDGKPIYQGIDTSFMVGPLNAGLNELADIVDKQAEMLAQLKAELDATKAEVAALKGN